MISTTKKVFFPSMDAQAPLLWMVKRKRKTSETTSTEAMIKKIKSVTEPEEENDNTAIFALQSLRESNFEKRVSEPVRTKEVVSEPAKTLLPVLPPFATISQVVPQQMPHKSNTITTTTTTNTTTTTTTPTTIRPTTPNKNQKGKSGRTVKMHGVDIHIKTNETDKELQEQLQGQMKAWLRNMTYAFTMGGLYQLERTPQIEELLKRLG